MAINPISSGAFAPSSSPAALLSFFCSIVFRQPDCIALQQCDAVFILPAPLIQGNKTLYRIHVTRNATVSSAVPNRAAAKRSSAFMSRETLRFPLRPRTGLPQNAAWTTGLRSTYGLLHCSEPGCRKTQQRTHVTRSTHGLLHCSEPGCRKTQQRTHVTRSTHGLLHCSEPGHRKTQQRTYVTRSNHGFLHCPEPGNRRYMYP